MSIALVIVFIFGINVAGGVSAVVENAQSLPGYLTMHRLTIRFQEQNSLIRLSVSYP